MYKRILKNLFKTTLIALPLFSKGQNQFPAEVEVVLSKAKSNRIELEKVINNFNSPSDSLKLKATYFLISNMDIHQSENYYWADSLNKNIEFDELKYPDFSSSLKAFDSAKEKFSKIHPITCAYTDSDTLTADFLITNINDAFNLWHQPFAKDLSFKDFCEYLLPYRISVEPIQDWRNIYNKRFAQTAIGRTSIDSVLRYLKKDITNWFTCTYNLEKRADPLPRLGALQLLFRKKGPCEDVADLTVFALRSLGIPASIDYVPAWATSSGNHTLNVVFNPATRPMHYDVLLLGSDSLKDFIREPAKVVRSTFSKQQNTLPYFEKEDDIPPGFMRMKNYIDVTTEYWPTSNVSCELFKSVIDKPKIAYAAVLNYGKWEPTWWGLEKNDSVVFSDMCKGAVFLPMHYIRGKLRVAGYPVASGYHYTKVLKPDTLNSITISIKEQENYLRFRSGKRYKLYYWNNSWKLVAEKITAEKTTELVFEKVPKDALYILVPEYTKNKERPFTINEKGEREWW